MAERKVRTTIVLPAKTLAQLKRRTSPRQRSAYIAEAVEERMKREAFRDALDKSFGAWTDESHPNLKTAEDVERYIREMRADEGLRHPARRDDEK